MSIDTALTDGLNPQQATAVTAPRERPILVLAGAGCGKTTVLVRRISFLLDRFRPAPSILGLTFTRKAAEEMSRRVERVCPATAGGVRPLITTFHGLGYRMLQERVGGKANFEHLGYSTVPSIATDSQRLGLLAAHSSSKERLALGVDLLQLDTLLQRHAVHPSKASSLDPEQRHLLNVLTLRLRSARVRNGLCEFADLIQGCLAIMRSSSDLADSYSRRFDVVLVDEFQDTNPLQVELLHRLCCPKTHVFAVGDDDQAIYGFRGADTGPILDFESHFPGALILKLETNYRSTPAILSCANRVFRGKADAYRKVLRAGRGERGRGTRPTKRRCASQADLYEWVARRIAAHGQRDGIPACSIALLFRLNQTKGHAEQYWKRLNPEGERPAFLTIHGAKGLEFPVVFLCDLEEGILPNYRLRGGRGRSGVSAWIGALFSPRSRSAPLDCDMEEEQRLFYVGVTRAQRYLYLLTCSSKEVRGITRKFLPSRFLRLV